MLRWDLVVVLFDVVPDFPNRASESSSPEAQKPRRETSSCLETYQNTLVEPTTSVASTMNAMDISEFLAEQRDLAPEQLQHLFISFEDYWERKLWHQLTDSLIEFFNHPESAPQRLPIYKTFVLTFAEKINQLKLVTLALSAATQCRGEL